jgi:hypothetical protein
MDVHGVMIETGSSVLSKFMANMPSQKAMGALASKAKVHIAFRTMRGQDANGGQFPRYKTKPAYISLNPPPGYPAPKGGKVTRGGKGKSMKFDSYETYKSAMGRGRKVNLMMAGFMLGSDFLFTVLNKTKAILFFARRSAAIAHAHHTGRYPFFGLNDIGSAKELNGELIKEVRKAKSKARREARRRTERV